jgi:hypothetical protein
MKFPKLIAVDGEGAKLFQTSAAPRGVVQLATGYIELNGERLGAPPDPLIGSILAHCPTTWIWVDDVEWGRRPIDIVLRGSVEQGFGFPRKAAPNATRKGRRS